MRLILRVVSSLHAALEAAAGFTPPLSEQWIDEVVRSPSSCCVSAFLSLPDAEQLNRAELMAAIEEVQSRSSIALSCPLSCCWLLVRRPASSSSSASALFALEDSGDVQCLVSKDELLLLADASLPVNSPTAPPSLLLELAARYRALPPLRVTRLTKPLSDSARLLRDFDRAQPCLAPRSDGDEPVWEAQAVRRHAAAAAQTKESRDYALRFRRALSCNGFVRVRLPPALQKRVLSLQAMQRDYFRLPADVKRSHAIPRARGLAANYQPPFGYVHNSDCNKEYFVVRQPPLPQSSGQAGQAAARASFALHPNSTQALPSVDTVGIAAAQYALPAEVDMAARVWPVFHELGSLCQDLMRLLLSSLDVAPDKVEAALRDTMAPAREALSFGHTSVLELFCYRADPAGSRSADAACLPCSIHTDASLLTLIPRSVGPAGLEIFNWRAGEWQAVEAQARTANECVVFAGDMLQRIVNGAVLASQHRVVFDRASGIDRYSAPFELFVAPDYVLDCGTLLSDSWQHFAEPRLLSPDCRRLESARTASGSFSVGLVSVNKSDAH